MRTIGYQDGSLHYFLEISEEVKDKIQKMDELGIELPEELFDVLDIFIMGAKKHGANSYLEPGVFTEKRLASIFRHLVKVSGLKEQSLCAGLYQAIALVEERLLYCTVKQENLLDEESGLSHFLHIQCNSLMFDIVKKRGILGE